MSAPVVIPEYYRKINHLYIKFSIVMMIIGLLAGITFQESSKKEPISMMLPAGVHLESIINLALVHGHIFLIGALVPLALTWLLWLSLSMGHKPVAEKSLKVGTAHYLIGAALAVLLMLYKGYYVVLSVRHGLETSQVLDGNFYANLNEGFFFGNHILRAATYGIVHTVMSVGLIIIVTGVWKSLKTQA